MATISAFSNTDGGVLIIGVSDRSEPLGMDIGKNTIEDFYYLTFSPTHLSAIYKRLVEYWSLSKSSIENLANQIKQNTDPVVYPSIRIQEISDKHVVVTEVKESAQKPVLAFGKAYMWIGRSNQKVGYVQIKNLVQRFSKIYWDKKVCEEANLRDFDEERVKWFLKEAKHRRGLDIDENTPFEEAVLRLKLLKDGEQTNGAVLLFAKHPQGFFLQSEVKCIRFKGVTVTGEMIDLRTVDGDVFNQLVESEKFIFNNIALSAWIEEGKLQRQERWEYPPDAIREALANAISHRDYESSSKVQVRIFDDRMEFWNPGRLPDGWTTETLKQMHESVPTNPAIAKQFFWVKYIEEVGTGTNKIIEKCFDWGLPEPEFKCTGTSLVVTLWKTKLTDEYLAALDLNERQRKIINYLKKNNRITSKECAELFSITERTARRDLRSLVDEKILIQAGTGKKSTYYELTV